VGQLFVNYNNKITGEPLKFGLAMAAGGGMVLIIVALAIGVIGGAADNSQVVGLLVAAGALLLLLGVGGWIAVVQPHRSFDDIDQPLYTGHHDGHHDDHHGEHDGVDEAGEIHVSVPALAAGQDVEALPESASTSSDPHHPIHDPRAAH
jgi:ABC-type nickel/cobalt efflux system permease component RcnA